MKVVAFIEPPQGDVIEKIRGHQSGAMVGGLWRPSSPRAPPRGDLHVRDPEFAIGSAQNSPCDDPNVVRGRSRGDGEVGADGRPLRHRPVVSLGSPG